LTKINSRRYQNKRLADKRKYGTEIGTLIVEKLPCLKTNIQYPR